MPGKDKEITFDEALKRMQHLCSKQEKCSFDIKKKLSGLGVPNDSITRVIHELKKNGFVDDSRYAHSFVLDKWKFQKWGRLKILQLMKFKAIPDHVAEEAISKIDENEYRQVIARELAKKERTIGDIPSVQKKAKLFRFASSRGYEAEIVYNILGEN